MQPYYRSDDLSLSQKILPPAFRTWVLKKGDKCLNLFVSCQKHCDTKCRDRCNLSDSETFGNPRRRRTYPHFDITRPKQDKRARSTSIGSRPAELKLSENYEYSTKTTSEAEKLLYGISKSPVTTRPSKSDSHQLKKLIRCQKKHRRIKSLDNGTKFNESPSSEVYWPRQPSPPPSVRDYNQQLTLECRAQVHERPAHLATPDPCLTSSDEVPSPAPGGDTDCSSVHCSRFQNLTLEEHENLLRELCLASLIDSPEKAKEIFSDSYLYLVETEPRVSFTDTDQKQFNKPVSQVCPQGWSNKPVSRHHSVDEKNTQRSRESLNWTRRSSAPITNTLNRDSRYRRYSDTVTYPSKETKKDTHKSYSAKRAKDLVYSQIFHDSNEPTEIVRQLATASPCTHTSSTPPHRSKSSLATASKYDEKRLYQDRQKFKTNHELFIALYEKYEAYKRRLKYERIAVEIRKYSSLDNLAELSVEEAVDFLQFIRIISRDENEPYRKWLKHVCKSDL